MGTHINRRSFTKLAAVPLALGTLQAAPAAPGVMKLGTQHDSSNSALRVLAALGVSHICSRLPSAKFDENWSVEGLTRLRERVESFGIRLEAVPLPLSSSYITKAENPNIMLGKSPERDREIDDICQMIRNCSRAGIPMVKYNRVHPRRCKNYAHQRPGRRHIQYVRLRRSQAGAAANRSGSGERGPHVGTDYVFRKEGCARRRGT